MSLIDILPNENWTNESMSTNTAEFRVGPKSEFLVTISTHGCVLVIKLDCLPGALSDDRGDLIPKIKNWFEMGIQEIIVVLDMHCTVHVSACKDSIKPNSVEFSCLHRLGNLGLVAKTFPQVICKFHTERLNVLNPTAFRAWFCTDPGHQNYLRESFR